jgi:ribosomal protein S18 acetylase RimI-like enzyme
MAPTLISGDWKCGDPQVMVIPARADHAEAASRCLADAFAADPLINFFFRTNPRGVHVAALEFFSLLLRLRIALEMPALVMADGATMLGAAMGYNTERPEWPGPFEREWATIESNTPGVAERFQAYERIVTLHRPTNPHYYLGVIGVHPSAQRRGAGKALLDGICRLSCADPLSSGVYLETANPASLKFYYRCGFVLAGEGNLGGSPLWCLFRPD